jgi:hypothetical protein
MKNARSPAIVRISDPAMQWHEVDLNELLACCRRELALRERCYPRWIDKGTIKPDKAKRELELMRSVCEFLVHCVFKAATRPPAQVEPGSPSSQVLTPQRTSKTDAQ